SRQRMVEVIERLGRALAPGGYLFLGHSESLRGISDAFETVHTHEAFYYRRRGEPASRASESGGSPLPARPTRASSKSQPRLASWGSSGGEPSSPTGTTRGRSSSSSDRIPAVVEPRPVIALTLALIKEERFAEALSALPTGGSGAADAEVELLTAVIL